MLKIFAAILTLLCVRISAQDEIVDVCGEPFMTSASGTFTSPLYPQNYPADTICEWVIEVETGNVIEITLDNIEVGPPYNLENSVPDQRTDYVFIFEPDINDDGDYYHRTQFTYPNINKKYRTKSNFAIVQFVSDNMDNFKGFNASYDSWNAVDYCDKNRLQDTGRVSVERTRCVDELKNDFYKTCYVSCHSHYVLSRSSKVTCEKGKFVPENPCTIIPWEVELCDITNLLYCMYSPSELAEYFTSKDSRFFIEGEEMGDNFDLNLFPDPTENATGLHTSRSTPGDPPAAVSKGIETQCFDKLIKYSYCVRKKNKDYAFSCNAFLKIKKLKKDVAQSKMDACYKCRAIDCSAVVYI